MAKSVFKGIGNAKVLKDANYVRPGHYWVKVERCRIGENRKKQELAFIEMTVIDVLDPETSVHRVGEAITHAVRADNDYFLPEVLAFISVAAGVDIETASDAEKEQAANMVFGDENPLGGTILELFARNIVTKENKDFTKINYRREVSYQEAAETLEEDIKNRFYPNGALDRLARHEAETTA